MAVLLALVALSITVFPALNTQVPTISFNTTLISVEQPVPTANTKTLQHSNAYSAEVNVSHVSQRLQTV